MENNVNRTLSTNSFFGSLIYKTNYGTYTLESFHWIHLHKQSWVQRESVVFRKSHKHKKVYDFYPNLFAHSSTDNFETFHLPVKAPKTICEIHNPQLFKENKWRLNIYITFDLNSSLRYYLEPHRKSIVSIYLDTLHSWIIINRVYKLTSISLMPNKVSAFSQKLKNLIRYVFVVIF